ncbi:MAG: hypothetical protein JWN04_6031, partial [Myxococcaceae bacterium]|nr:hypothetical protein [Myxococcaceae bacterium]
VVRIHDELGMVELAFVADCAVAALCCVARESVLVAGDIAGRLHFLSVPSGGRLAVHAVARHV